MFLTHLANLTRFVAATATASCGGTGTCDTGLPKVTAGRGELQSVLSIVFGIFAAVSVLMIVISGMRFVTAQGNPNEISKARNTIVYAIAGLVISLAAEAIVEMVLGKVNP